jgi:hypothetical protein
MTAVGTNRILGRWFKLPWLPDKVHHEVRMLACRSVALAPTMLTTLQQLETHLAN